MNSKSLLIHLYALINKGIRIWTQHGNIKLFVPKDITFDDEDKNFIKSNKVEILEFLCNSNIHSKEYTPLIIKTNFNLAALSFAQERLWFIERYEQGTNAYNIPMVFKTDYNDKEIELIEKSVRGIVSRHEILRTLIKQDDEGNRYQLVLDDKEHPLKIRKIKIDSKSKLNEEVWKEVKHIYDLSNEYPIRICLYELHKEDSYIPQVNKATNVEYYISVIIHHIAFDGWSTDIFIKELQEYYKYYSNQLKGLESKLNLPELSVQYKDFAIWQRAYLSGEKLKKQLAYWKKKLYEYETLNLVTDKIRPKEINYKGKDVFFEIDENISNKLRILSKELKVSLYSVLLAAYYLLLRVYSNQNDIIVGIPIANRHYTQIENLIGFFVNTLVLRIEVDSNDLVTEFIKKVGHEVIEAQLHQDLPFERLVEEIEITKDTSRHPIFQVMFSVQSFGGGLQWQRNKSMTINHANPLSLLQPYEMESSLYNVAKFDLSIFIDDSQPALKGNFDYAISLYKRETILRFIDTYTKILHQLADLADKKREIEREQAKITNITYLNSRDHKHIVYDWNNNDKDYPSDKTINQLFEEQVKKTPDNIAVVYEDTRLTYEELNNIANSLAHYLIQIYDIKPDTLISLCLDRSEYMLIAILATLKVGAAYVPIDPSYPDERIRYILEDTNTKIILTNELHKIRLSNLWNTINSDGIISIKKSIVGTGNLVYLGKATKQLSILPIDTALLQGQLSVRFVQAPITSTTSSNLAYVIYTSGTTGNPKGVMIEHKGVVNLAVGKTNALGEAFNDTQHIKNCLWYANYIFDAHIWELYASIFNGNTIYIVNNDIRQSTTLLEYYIRDNLIDTALLSPTLLDKTTLLKLKVILVGGDKANKEINDYYVNGNIDIVNAYGPTEITLYSNLSYHNSSSPLNIGSPISNAKSYVLSHELIPFPIGAIGELYIGGVGLARGYLNRSDLTAEKFIANPFQTEEEKRDKTYGLNGRNSRMYKTGDLVRWLPDGNLEYIGRNDFQVKIRGYRIELGEIESALLNYEGIKQSVVLVKDSSESTIGSNDKYLVGYYVSDNKLDEENLLSYLKDKLPEYMVPSILIHLEKLPLTINSKLDRKALPDPEFTNVDNYTAPRNDIEKKVANIWAEVLGLPVNKIGIKDNFFRLGGHSLKATQVVARIRKEYKVELSLRSLFENPTIEELAKLLIESKSISSTQEFSLEKQPRGKVISLSFAQQRLWFLDQLIDNKAAYNIPSAIRLKGRLDKKALEKSLQKVVERHESLRTYFKVIEGEAQQVLENNVNIAIDVKDLSTIKNKKIREAKVILLAEGEATEIFDLNKPFLIRAKLIKLSPKEHVLLVTMHHIVSDGWSVGILIEELCNLYNHYAYKVPIKLKKLPIQYIDYSIWQREWLKGEVLEKQLNYWKEYLKGAPEVINLPTDKVRPLVSSYIGKTYRTKINKDLTEKLRVIGDEEQVTLFMMLSAVLQILLYKYSNQNDIIIGSPIAGRRYKEVEGLVGFFVNTLVLRGNLSHDLKFRELIKQVKERVLAAQLHQDIPFEQLVEHLEVSRSLNRHPLFQVMFVLQNVNNKKIRLKELSSELLEISKQQVKFDIIFNIQELDSGELSVLIEYTTDLFYDETIERMGDHLNELIRSIVRGIEEQISKLNILTEKERQKVLVEWNDTDEDYPRDKTIHQLFEEQVEKTPDSIAVVYEGKQLSYRELNERANRLAQYLIKRYYIKPDTLVALLLDRSEHMIISILGVLKAGGAYVPMDPEYPKERIKFMLDDTKALSIITMSTKVKEKLPLTTSNIICLDQEQEMLDTYSSNNPTIITNSNYLAYVIYTSGTTGKPKGVMIDHKGVVNLAIIQGKDFGFNLVDINTKSKDIKHCLCYANYIFDAHVSEIFTCILYGNVLYIIDNYIRQNIILLNAYLKHNKINVCTIPPSLLGDKNDSFFIDTLVVAGERTNKTILNHYLQHNTRVINGYGPTESTVCSSLNIYKEVDSASNIGTPISNTKAYVLSLSSSTSTITPLPIGVIGELYIGGVGLARGYLNNPELTAEKFINNPFQTEEEKNDTTYGPNGRNSRLYKTGDLVRWLPDGNLEYIGRTDFQVKIRGFRIELEEIENVLESYDNIKQCVIMVREHKISSEDNDKYLAAYYTSTTGERVEDSSLVSYLSLKLPDYMIPSVFIHLEKLPLTTNGKLDRKALPDHSFVIDVEKYVAPSNELESKLCSVFADILGLNVSVVGVRNDFFRLGGNSILAIRLVSKINKEIGLVVNVAAIFTYKNIKDLAKYLKSDNKNNIVITKTPGLSTPEKQLLSFAQERLWFIEKYEKGTNAYNIPIIFKLTDKVLLPILKKSITSIVKRHEILRSFIRQNNDDNAYQLVSDQLIHIEELAISNKQELYNSITQDANHIYDLTSEYPIRVKIYKLNDDGHYLSLVIHHIAFDGWSIDVFLRDVLEYYRYYKSKSEGISLQLNLPELTIQYKDFALWQREYLTGKVLDKQLTYWKSKLRGYETLNLVTDYPRPLQIDYKGKYVDFEINKNLSTSLKETAKSLGVSLYTILLAAYYLMLRSYTNQDDIIIGTPVANRHHIQTENLIGFFINSLPLRVKVNNSSDMQLIDFIKHIGTVVIEAQLHQDLPFEKLVDELEVSKDTSRHPIFQTMFSVQGFGHDKRGVDTIIDKMYTSNENDIYNVAKFDLEVFIDDSRDILKGSFNYRINLYKDGTIKRFINTYLTILEQVGKILEDTANITLTLSDLKYLTEKEQKLILTTWNDTDKPYPQDKTIHKLFEEQVEKTPDNIAIVYENNRLTYKQLNERANRLAHYLTTKYYIKPDTLVALLLDKSEHMVISILGVLKAGGAYVPMDPDYPDERIRCMLQDTGSEVVITNEKYEDIVNTLVTQIRSSTNILSIDSTKVSKNLVKAKCTNPATLTSSTNLAYVIYTSGTTGKPKGVMIEHKGCVVTTLCVINRHFKNNSILSGYSLTNYVFDIFALEYMLPFFTGGSLYLGDYNFMSLDCSNYQFIQMTPIVCSLKLDNLFNINNTKLLIGGENLPQDLLYRAFLRSVDLINLYGPTETTIWSTSKIYNENTKIRKVCIGRPLDKEKVYVLSPFSRTTALVSLPIGAIGELYIGGVGLARGYLNNPELTSKKFINNPFQTEEEKNDTTYGPDGRNSRLYKTGDLVRWLSDGNLEYIGRTDFQVKIRGFRIELEEIENIILSHPEVKQCVVTTQDVYDKQDHSTATKYLIAYYIRNVSLKSSHEDDSIDTWKELYNTEYETLEINSFKENFSVWNSSYTGKAIKKSEMIEWITETSKRIKALKPQVVLEIGSGSGLVLFNVIDECKYYYACDFSEKVINYTNKVLQQFGYTKKIMPIHAAANNVEYELLPRPYDTVIMNSVIQYFPTHNYLESVINKAILNLNKQGKIFIGDVRDYRLLSCFHHSILNYKSNKVSKAELIYSINREKELLLSPEYFFYLMSKNDAITHVEIMPKIGVANHEMNKYRYDVVLYINNTEKITHVSSLNFVNVEDIESYVKNNMEEDVLYIRYPNKRLVKDEIAYKSFVGIEIEADKFNNLVSINEIIKKLEKLKHRVEFFLDLEDPLYLNLVVYPVNKNSSKIFINYTRRKTVLKSELYNNPLYTSKLLEMEFKNTLTKYLSSRLPDYMIPSVFIHLEKLPLTTSGKLDRKALPDHNFVGDIKKYVAPSNELESKLCSIFADILGLDVSVVGIRNDFFKLGGNSILAIRLVSKLNNNFSTELTIKDIFNNSTIEQICESIKKYRTHILLVNDA